MPEQRVDVSDLEPPEPLVETLSAAESLRPGDYLRMRHRREPCLLFGELDQRGFGYVMRQAAPSAVEVLIWRRGDELAETAARLVLSQATGNA